MRKYSWLTPVAVLIFVLVTLVFLSPLVIPKGVSWPIKQKLNLGLDLKGGTQIVLAVQTDKLPMANRADAVKNNIEIIRNRIDQFGIAEPTIQKIGESDILVQLPGVKDPAAAENLVKQSAILEFKLVANPEESERFLAQLDQIIQANLSRFPTLAKMDAEMKSLDKEESSVEDSLKTSSGIFRSLIVTSERDYAVRNDDVEVFRALLQDTTFVNLKPKGYDLALESFDETKRRNEEPKIVYVLKSAVEVQGSDIDGASMEIGSTSSSNPQMAGKPYIALTFTRTGARKFANVTGDNIHERLAIVVDNAVYSAPVIQDRIPDGKATITGIFSNEEARSLAILLNNESLTAPIVLKNANQVSATLGTDSIKSGLIAGLVGLLAVMIFMVFFYNLSGLVTDFILIFNVGFILAAMTIFGGTLTMPGIAGIILSIGMSVDANVLIFERIREEMDAGKSPRSAADSGFKRASVTIWDSNITTVIAAFVLYQFGTGPVRGFALTLTIGIVGSIFCALVFLRYLMDKLLLSGNRQTLSI
ncbi:MAG TPA: protein translocase subunit SecD [Candidatus Syntrophosphaera sp.]|jgi:protein-export membrane protein SecD|nr:protein translocase subunit SecD [Candidatus Syntrophosphaera sp.]HPW37816.1 protein translocase subunit SecD [Candidatus Syntrophosphaera sp.]HPX66860.1 protein translocase subunit SecD [Candidatus Syntrophosphaera sp.]HQC47109.1 protein translocase subunit SecD [Candidatus Syntrophosphaera sp.]